MSVTIRKRIGLVPDSGILEGFELKRWRSNSPLAPAMQVSFPVPTPAEKLLRLCLLFPTMEKRELNSYLERTDCNLEEAIQLLDDLNISKQDLARTYSEALVQRFANTSRDEAAEIGADAFRQYYQERRLEESRRASSVGLPQETQRVREGIQKIVHENVTLKKAVVRLKERTDQVDRIERENKELRERIQQVNLENYVLRMRLQSALEEKNEIRQSKDIF
jgi:hypothetical protein